MSRLAIFGGQPEVQSSFQHFNTFDDREKQAVMAVMDNGVLSDFVGAWCDQFYGGEQVRAFEQDCAEHYCVKNAIAVNSWTSGLICAVGALDIEPGDEILVSPWTMCASATAILVWNAIPVFVDIDPTTFNLDPQKIEAKITSKTRAILVPHIFGYGANMAAIKRIAQTHGLRIIEDAAQAPAALFRGEKLGAIGDIGGFSLNYHKHIHTGEGGIIVTNDDKLAERMRMIRNHAEAVVEHKPELGLNNMVGFNFRLGEMESAIGRVQLQKLHGIVAARQVEAEALINRLRPLPGIALPEVAEDCTHDYYILGMRLTDPQWIAKRQWIVDALRAEGVPALAHQYVNVHRYPMYQQKLAYGRGGYPFSLATATALSSYGEGGCPVAEELQDKTYIGLVLCLYHFSPDNINDIANAFEKVWQNMESQ